MISQSKSLNAIPSKTRPMKRNPKTTSPKNKVEKKYACCMCQDNIFKAESELVSHIKSTHLSNIEGHSTRKYTKLHIQACKYCKQKFRLASSLKNHFLDPSFIEPQRNRAKEYENSKKKEKIKRNVPRQCTVCGKVMANQTYLKIHEFRKHASEYPFECLHPGCNKKFAAQIVLKFHMRRNHAERKHVCEVFAYITR